MKAEERLENLINDLNRRIKQLEDRIPYRTFNVKKCLRCQHETLHCTADFYRKVQGMSLQGFPVIQAFLQSGYRCLNCGSLWDYQNVEHGKEVILNKEGVEDCAGQIC